MSAADHEGKIRRVPRAWADDPEGWWAHVAACDACAEKYAPPEVADGSAV